MRHFRSLLINQTDIRMPGLHILAFAVHRHLQEHASVEPHRHRWCQVILYLSGRGRQVFGGGDAGVEPGTLVVIPPGISHAFQRGNDRAPLCLMIDFRLEKSRLFPAAVCSMNRSEISQVRQHLAHLIRLQAGASGVLRWESASVILQLLITLLRAANWLERVPPPPGGAGGSVMRRLLSTVDPATPLRHVVQRSGYQRDHLNRLVKRETGLTLGQFRTQRRLARAKDLLGQGVRVADVAEAVGLLDQSYFARWFRRQTGQAPSRWSRRALG
jgi:AraC family transcriptional regulator, transcriptional activator of pobA